MTTPRRPDSTIGPFREKDSIIVTAKVLDNATPPVAIPGAQLSTMTLTLYAEGSNVIINSRDDVDIKSNVNAGGILTLPLGGLDMAIIDGGSTEYHRALFEWTWNAGQRGSWEVRIIVSDVNRVS